MKSVFCDYETCDVNDLFSPVYALIIEILTDCVYVNFGKDIPLKKLLNAECMIVKTNTLF